MKDLTSKKASLFDRLQAVEDWQKKAEKTFLDNQKLQNLGLNYQIACTQFWEAILRVNQGYRFDLRILSNPSPSFFLNSKKQIYSLYYFPICTGEGTIKPYRHITRESFDFFLRHFCGVVNIPKKETDIFFEQFVAYFKELPYDSLKKIVGEISKNCPTFLEQLMRCNIFQIDKNLYFRYSNDLSLLHPHKKIFYTSALLFEDTFKGNYPGFTIAPVLKRKFVRALLQVQNISVPTNTFYVPVIKAERNEAPDCPCLGYYISLGELSDFYIYDSSKDEIIEAECFGYQPIHKVKYIPWETSDGFETAKRFFEVMCGSNAEIMDKFAVSLYELMHPGKQTMQVIYTAHHKDELVEFFSDATGETAVLFTKGSKGEKCVPSLNQLVKKNSLRKLYLAQTTQSCFVQVSDRLPTEENLAKIKKLLRGTSIAIKSPIMAAQSYKNHLGIVCVTDDLSTAKKLQKALKANVIDLSVVESATEHIEPFSISDIHWFFTAYIPYGLRLHTLKVEGRSYDTYPFGNQKKPPLSIEDGLRDFWEHCCKKANGAFCSTHDLYAGFYSYWSAIHPDVPLDCTDRKLNKMFREVSGLSGLDRKHTSRSKPSLRGYKGIQLSVELESISPVTAPSVAEDLDSYLEYVNRYRIRTSEIST